MVSIQVFATPIRGRLRSASVNPMALNMERAPARSRPSVMPRLMCLRSIVRDYTTQGFDGKPQEQSTTKDTTLHEDILFLGFPLCTLVSFVVRLLWPGRKRGTCLAAGSPVA